MDQRIYLSSPHMGGAEQNFVNEAFDTNWISPIGPNIDGFEKDLSQYVGRKHAAALSSGTAAIHLALRILGIGAGDEVICSSFTFAGSCNPIVYQGATPVFIDAEEKTWNMDPCLLREGISARMAKGYKPAAIIIVHLYGMPAQMEEIIKIAEEFNIPLIEDAAEALGASYKGKKMGSFGDLSILSFNGNKIITTSGGGALLSDNKAYIEKAKFLATQARDAAPHYEHSEIGFNYRLSNISAGIGRGQMQVLEERVRQRRKIFDFYRDKLESIDGLSFLDEPETYFSNRWLTTVLLDPKKCAIDREDVRTSMEKHNIETRPLWKPMHLQPVFSGAPYFGNGTSERLFEHGLCLPSGSNMKDSDLERVTQLLFNLF